MTKQKKNNNPKKKEKPFSQIIRELNEFLFYGKMWDISDK